MFFYLMRDSLRQAHGYDEINTILQETSVKNPLHIVHAQYIPNLQYLFPNAKWHCISDKNFFDFRPNLAVMWSNKEWPDNIKLVEYAYKNNLPLLTAENGYLRSAYTWPDNSLVPEKFSSGISFLLEVYPYFDATNISSTVSNLNDPEFKLSHSQKERVYNLIKRIVDNKLTKYNCQPFVLPNSLEEIREKQSVLVVDQSYLDHSVEKAFGNTHIFKLMVRCAIEENPHSEILIKMHPDAAHDLHPGYMNFDELKTYYGKRVRLITQEVNPYTLLNLCQKVYVCTSQLGFEAAISGKDVEVFGCPVYAGWGFTNDRISVPNRHQKRNIYDFFYSFYILNTNYIDPIKKQRCEIEDAIDFLVSSRSELLKIIN